MVTADSTIMSTEEGQDDGTLQSPTKNVEVENHSSDEGHKGDESLGNDMVTADDTIISTQEGQNNGTLEGPMKDAEELENHSSDIDHRRDGTLGNPEMVTAEGTFISSTQEVQNDGSMEGLMKGAGLENHSSDTDHQRDGCLANLKTVTAEGTFISTPESQNDGTPRSPTKSAEKLENHLFYPNHKTDGGDVDNGNGVSDVVTCLDDSQDHLVQMAIELNFQNEYLKAQFEGLKNQHLQSVGSSKQINASGQEEGASEHVKELHEKIRSLNREIQEQKETQTAAEGALKHLQVAYSETDAKAQELSAKLIEVQQKMDQEIKERDDKYVELDSKFGRLLKRAKQRIQELQKEKDDLEARLRVVNEMADQASSQQASLQQELERTRQQANEALRSMDVERQQLRTANNKLRESVDEMRHSLEAKENALEGLQHTIFEKDQRLEDMQGLLQSMDEKRQASISELSAKHQKHLESLEAQLADALSDRSKAAETISSLQVQIAEKESEYAELDAASTGEAVRLGAAIEEAKGEIVHLKQEHEKEKEIWDAAYQALKSKLEASESTCLRLEIEAAKMRSQLELELSIQNQLLNTRDSELMDAKEEINHLQSEFSAYKVRAHALLQKKDAELLAAKDTEVVKAQEEAIKEAERELALTSAERDKALRDLQVAMANHDKELAARDSALTDAKQRIRSIEVKLDSVNAHYLLDKEAWQRNLENLEETWRLKYEALEAQNNGWAAQDLQKELEVLRLQYKKLQEEHDSFRDLADRVMEEKDKEIAKLLDDNKNLHRSIEVRQSVEYNDNQNASKEDSQLSSIEMAEQQILLLARQQAQREEELAQSQRQILALQDEIEELERENRLHNHQQAMLKTELRNMERMQKREGVDMTYLKNVILKLLETGEVEVLLPVIGMLLQFSPEEIKKCQQAYSSSTESSSPATAQADAASSGSGSLFSRFSFT
ncbi:protein GRIP [Magnolia sinica]|uniref:protein GRIP n=1 Tax=Magnolia sinica TaxID=86752 RepID=UPI002658DF38|nr:protein GRIP [Magnolia sinica]